MQQKLKLGSSETNLRQLARSVHTGDIYGLLSRIVMSISSFLFVIVANTGVVIWWKKLAI